MTEDHDDLPRDSNDGAYVTEQTRSGPPLGYVAEKTRRTLEALHEVMGELEEGPTLYSHGRDAFMNALKGHLALNNLLALMNDAGAEDRLLGMSREQFGEWLDRVDREGSVTG